MLLKTAFALVFLVGTSQAFAVVPSNNAGKAARSMAVSMTVEGLDVITQLDPAVMGGIAASILGVGAFAITKANGKTEATSSPTPASRKSAADVSIPYDAAARLAYEEYCENGKEIDFETFQTKYEQLTVAGIKAKTMERELLPHQTADKIDVSIPYDAAAKLAYEQWLTTSGKDQWGSQAEYEKFKAKYEEMCIAQVTFKKLQREMA